MALLFADPGGKYYATNTQAGQGLYVSANFNIISSGLPSGAIESTAIAQTAFPAAVITVPNTSGPYTLGARVYYTSLPTNGTLFQFNDNAGNSQMQWQVLANGTVQLQRGGNVLVATAANIIQPNTWMYVECQGFCNSSSGTIALRVNNSLIANLTGVNTQNQGTAIIGQVGVLDKWTYAQDIYITDSTTPVGNTAVGFLGDVSMPVLRANRQGVFNQYAPNGAATNWQAVADITPDDLTTYTFDSTPGDRVSFGYGAVATSSPIVGIVHVTRAEKSDSGTRTFSQTIRSNGVDSVAAAVSPGTSFAYSTQALTADPSTGTAWTVAGINAVDAGIKTVS